jgi:hypothetical protein
MNLEQLVKETVAKIVAEKHLTPAEMKKKEEIVKAMKGTFKGPAPAMYAIATKKAEKLAEDNLNEDYEVAMAQDSLDSIIRAAMMLKAQMGDREINLPAWIQDHITNSENYINQAAKGYHESDAQIANHAGEEDESMYESQQELDENKMDKEELKQAQIEKAYDHLEKMKANTKLFSKDDIKKAEERIEKLEAELDALADKSTNESLDEWTMRRWQHYAGIK